MPDEGGGVAAVDPADARAAHVHRHRVQRRCRNTQARRARRELASVRAGAVERDARARAAGREGLPWLAVCSTSSGTGNARFESTCFFKLNRQAAVSSFRVLSSGVHYFVILCVSVRFAWQNRSRTFPVAIF